MTGKSCSFGLSRRSFVNCSYPVKYVHVVTSIKRSPVLSSNIFCVFLIIKQKTVHMNL